MVIMDTKHGGVKAKAIIDKLSFDGAIHTDMIGYFGGLWLLWNSDMLLWTLATAGNSCRSQGTLF